MLLAPDSAVLGLLVNVVHQSFIDSILMHMMVCTDVEKVVAHFLAVGNKSLQQVS